jgi:lambda family phage portal protein
VFKLLATAAKSFYALSNGNGYDAVAAKNRRQAPTGILKSEDGENNPTERRKLLSAGRDINRNFALAAWMIRRHLDYVSTFNFQAKTGDPSLDDQLERLVRWWSNPYNCDVTGRFSLQKMIRMAEMRRVIDGDVFLLKLRDGTLQAIEGDRVRTPDGGLPDNLNKSQLTHGVRTAEDGTPEAYCICRRSRTSDAGNTGSAFEFERLVAARNIYHFAYYDRFDQVRGISPLAPAFNTLRDVYEGFDYALAKLKVSQLFGLVFYREKDDAVGEVATSDDGTGYEVDFGKGPALLDLEPGDKAEFLESKTPSAEFQSFTQSMISVALKALDIPYSFYAENFTNYSGARQALLQYELSAKIKRHDLIQMLDHLTNWRINLWIQDGVLPDAGYRWDWVPQGISWIDPLKEVNANIAAIQAGLTTRTRVLRQQGEDFYDTADEMADEVAYLVQKKLPVQLPPVATLQEVEAGNAQPVQS